MTTTVRHTRTKTLLPAVALGALVLLAVCARPAAAATRSLLKPTPGCDVAVINDWADNNRVDRLYAPSCYTKAIQRLSKYSDLEGYSSASDDIHRAQLAAIKEEERGASPDQGKTTTNPGGVAPGPGNGGNGPSGNGPSGNGPSGSGPLQQFGDKIGPSNATSVPLPLIVLGALALLLLLAAGGTWLARRIQARRSQARRMAPAPAPVRRR